MKKDISLSQIQTRDKFVYNKPQCFFQEDFYAAAYVNISLSVCQSQR